MLCQQLSYLFGKSSLWSEKRWTLAEWYIHSLSSQGCFVCKQKAYWRCVRCEVAAHAKCAPWPADVIYLKNRPGRAVCWRHSSDWHLEKEVDLFFHHQKRYAIILITLSTFQLLFGSVVSRCSKFQILSCMFLVIFTCELYSMPGKHSQLHCFQLCCRNFLLLISKFCFFKDPLLELAYLSNLIIGNLSTCVLKFPYFRVQLLYIRTTFLFNEIMVNIKSNMLVYGTMPSITLLVLKGIFLSQLSVSWIYFSGWFVWLVNLFGW